MDKIVSFLNNRIFIAIVVGLFLLSFVRGLARR
jgi:hypothetical protein